MNIESVLISSLSLDPSNARKHAPKNLESIKGSLAKFGQQKPIVVGNNNVVIAGNGTLEAAKALGWDSINIVRTELEGADAIAFAIADNRTAELAEWDAGILSDTLKSLQDMEFDLGSIGFDQADLDAMIASQAPSEGLTDPDEIPENVETRCKPGDLWQLGNHRLLCGDSTNVQHVERLMGGEKADMVFTDPPYGLDWSGGTWAKAHSKAKEWDKLLEQDVIDFILQLSDKIILWGGNYYKVPPSRCWLSFRKTNALKTGSDFELAWTSFDKCCKEFAAACNSEGKRQHPTQKPVALAEWCFENYGNPKSVLDLFLGSGSTLIACEKTNRRCFGCEIDPHYCDVIISRWEKFTGKTAELLTP